jgi:CHAT domain-containing protein
MLYHFLRWLSWLGLMLLGWFLSLLLHQFPPGSLALAQAAPSSLVQASAQSLPQLTQQGLDRYRANDFAGAIVPWQQALSLVATPRDRALIHTNLAQAYRQLGQLATAIQQWQAAIQIYRSPEVEDDRATVPLLIEQAQIYSDLGQNRRAVSLAQSALTLLRSSETQPQPADLRLEAAAQGSLGSAAAAVGDYEQALAAYQRSLELARSLRAPDYLMTALNNLGNLYVRRAERAQFQATTARLEGELLEAKPLLEDVQRNLTAARQAYEESWQVSQSLGDFAEATALLNLTRLREQFALEPNRRAITAARSRAATLLSQAPNSRPKAYALLNLARSLQTYPILPTDFQTSRTLAEQALTVAQAIGDRRAESFALGNLGQLAEAEQRYPEAIAWTRRAQFAAQQVNAAESLYLWQWQIGRLLNVNGDKAQAIAAYEQAIATLQSIRGDLVASNREFQLNFRDSVEPVYRELMGLLLQDADLQNLQGQAVVATADARIQRVLDILELLKLAEIQNFFGDECVEVARTRSTVDPMLTDPNAVVIYSVILKQQTEMIVKAPNGRLTHHTIAIPGEQMQREIDRLRRLLEKRSTDEYLPQAQRVYAELVKPLESDFATIQPKTLVFVNDGVLRNVPMAALHDGQQFLIEKYAIATTPGLNLTAGGTPKRDNLRALILGLSVERDPFAPLTNVEAETAGVKRILGGTRLLNQTFTLANLQARLQQQSYPIVHIATHGKFGANAETTFLVAFDDRIRLEQIDVLLRSRPTETPVELLTLSACQTAAGDNRTALGIAGVAVRAGVKSALATLWYINDEATVPLIETFYSQLRQPNLSKAEALQQAQKAMIADLSYSHPGFWSPFILVGNWL